MNKFILAVATGTAVMVAPVGAQYSEPGSGDTTSMGNRIAQLEARLQDGISAGTIDRSEARTIYRQIRDIRRVERRYNADGISQDERRDLQQRIRFTRNQLRTADGGRSPELTEDEYYDRFARENPSNRYREVSEVCASRSGMSGVLGALLGGDNCLTVGDRAPSSLGMVPSQYSDQFRDDARYFYRYLNGNVVQIDTRSGNISRIFDVYQSASR